MASSTLKPSFPPQISTSPTTAMFSPSCACGALCRPRVFPPSHLHPQTRGCLFLQPSRLQVKAPSTSGYRTVVRSYSTKEKELREHMGLEEVEIECRPHEGEEAIEKNKVITGLDGQKKMVRICDKLIDVFMVDKPRTTDWRRLLAFSKEWNNIRPYFYKRCQERADCESDPGMKHNLLRLGRKLKEIDDDVQRHDELLQVVKTAPSEITEIVAKRRKDFTREFFEHLHTIAESYYENPAKQNELASFGNTCLAAVEAYDSASESIEAVNAAQLKFQDIVNSPNIDVACKKIDNLAEKKQLDSTLMLMLTKAWSAAKESNMVKDEAKDIMYHLYKTARGNLQRLMPKEIRILKYLLTIEDPEERVASLRDAFTPGDEIQGQDVDALYTTPEKLLTWIRAVVDAYHFSREGTLIKEARDLMNPKVIQRLEEMQKLLQDQFM